MRRLLPGLPLALLLICLPAAAADWPPIPPEVWAIKSGDKGAIVLDKWVRLTQNGTEARVRVRIFSEAGLAAASLPFFDHAYTIEGRTVQPEGRETRFDSAKDLVEQSRKLGSMEGQQHTLVPPGLTTDCVVEYHYNFDSRTHGSQVNLARYQDGDLRAGLAGDMVVIPVLESYPVARKIVEMARFIPISISLLCPPELRPVKVENSAFDEYRFPPLPAVEWEPYSLQGALLPRFVCFRQPPVVRQVETAGPAVFWKAAVENLWRPFYGVRLKTGSGYLEWSRALREGVAGDPWAQAREIGLRLAERMRDMGQLGDAELAALTRKKASEAIRPLDLEDCVKRGETLGMGMHLLLYRLLADQGLAPVLLFTMDRQEQIFHYDLPNAHQFSTVLIGVAGKDGALRFFDPGRRFLPPGLTVAMHQGARGLLVDLRSGSCGPYAPEHQGAGENTARFDFELEIGEAQTFRMRAAFAGLPEYEIRRAYGFLPAEEQGRALKEGLEKAHKDFTVTRAEVEHATELRQPPALVAEGSFTLEEGRRRSFPPFPGLPYPLQLPTAWPAQRTWPILMPPRREFTAVSRFRVPEGWKLRDEPDSIHENRFGRVAWQVRRGAGPDPVWEVTYTLTVATPTAAETAYPQLREYLGWMEAASRRTLTLERP